MNRAEFDQIKEEAVQWYIAEGYPSGQALCDRFGMNQQQSGAIVMMVAKVLKAKEKQNPRRIQVYNQVHKSNK